MTRHTPRPAPLSVDRTRAGRASSRRSPSKAVGSAAEALSALAPARPIRLDGPGVLRAGDLLLRPLDASDRKAFCRLIADSRAHLERFSPLHLPGETDDMLFDRQLDRTREGLRTGSALRRVIETPGGALAGAINLHGISRGLEWSGDLNLWLGPAWTGRGIARRAAAAVVEHALAHLPDGLGLLRLAAWVTPENTRSQRLMEALGFRRCGDDRSYLQTGERWALHERWERTALLEDSVGGA